MPESPGEHRARARHAILTRWNKDGAVDEARRNVENYWLNQVDPDRKLPEAERYRRAERAKRAHMSDLARRSAKARRLKREAEGGDGALPPTG